MNGVGHCRGDGTGLDRSALVHADGVLDALRFQPEGGFVNRDDLRRELLRERNDVVNVIEVAVRYKNYVHAI